MSSSKLDPERWEKVKDIFAEAAELPDDQARLDFVEKQSAGDPAVRAEVLRLLHFTPAANSSGAFIDRAPLPDGIMQQAAGRMDNSGGSLIPGEVLGGRFKVIRRVGAGGMGEVYQAEDQSLGVRIAIKTIRPEIAGDAHMLSRFKREIYLARQVTHPNVCRVYDLVSVKREATGAPLDFLTMEFLDGETLSQRLRAKGPLPLKEALPLIEQMTAGLAAAHHAGVVHRDLKSSNVFLANENGTTRVVLTDFGLARSTSSGEAATQTGSGWGAGTPLYMAPEQLEGKPAGPPADIYALGIVMYEMAVNALPYQNESPLLIAVKRLKEKPQAPRLVNPQVDARWESVILRCLELLPGDRFPSADAVSHALESRSSLSLPYIRTSQKRTLGWWGAALAAVVMLGVTGLYYLSKPPDLNPEAQRLYRDGVNAIADGSFLTASKQLEKVAAQRPDHLPAAVRLAEAFAEMDQPGKANQQLLRVAGQWEFGSSNRLLREGVRLYLLHDYDGAIAEMKKRADGASADEWTTARLDLARMYQRASLLQEAEREYQAVLGKDASHPSALLQLGVVSGQMGNRPAADKYFERAVTAYRASGNVEGQGEAALQRAVMYSDVFTYDLEKATAAASHASILAEQGGRPALKARAQLVLAKVAVMRSDPEKGQALAQEAIALAKKFGFELLAAQGLNDLGLAQISLRQGKEPERVFTEALKIANENGAPLYEARAKLGLAKAYVRLNTKDLEKTGMALTSEALAFAEKGHYRLEEYDAWKTKGDILFVKAKFGKAAEYYRKAVELADKPWELKIRKRFALQLATVVLKQGGYPEAIKLYRDLIQFYGQDQPRPLTYWNCKARLINAMRSMGRNKEALEASEELLNDSAQKNPALKHGVMVDRAAALTYLGKMDEATRELEKLKRVAVGRDLNRDQDINFHLCFINAFGHQPKEGLRQCSLLRDADPAPASLMGDIHIALSQVYLDLHDYENAVKEGEEAAAFLEQSRPIDSFMSFALIAAAKEGSGNSSGAEAARRQSIEVFRNASRTWSDEDKTFFLSSPVMQQVIRQAKLRM